MNPAPPLMRTRIAPLDVSDLVGGAPWSRKFSEDKQALRSPAEEAPGPSRRHAGGTAEPAEARDIKNGQPFSLAKNDGGTYSM